MRVFSHVLAIIVSICFIFTIIFGCVETIAFNDNYYIENLTQANVPSNSGLSEGDIEQASIVLLDYVKGQRDDISYKVNIQGISYEVFNQTEFRHMQDVKRIYDTASSIRYSLIVIGILTFIAVCFTAKRDILRVMSRAYLGTVVVFGLGIGGIALWMSNGFYEAWNGFHEVLFTNDLWLFDPSNNNIVQILNLNFFEGLVGHIIISALIIIMSIAVVMLGALFWDRRRRIRIGDM